MKEVGAYEAKTRFSSILDAVEKGDRISITRRGRPVALLVPAQEEKPQPASVIAALRALRKSVTLGDIPLRQLIEEGRR